MAGDGFGRVEEILDRLDSVCADHEYLAGMGNAHYLGARSQALGFACDDEWLLAFQELHYGLPTGQFAVHVTALGNRLADSEFLAHREMITGPDGASGFAHEIRDFLGDLCTVQLEVRGRPLRRRFCWDDYRAAGIDPADIDYTDTCLTTSGSGTMPPEVAFLRMLAHQLGDELLLSPEEVLTEVGRPGLRPVFAVGQWRVPDVTEDERPSDLASYWAMACSLGAGRPVGLQACSRNPNTHWSNWREYE